MGTRSALWISAGALLVAPSCFLSVPPLVEEGSGGGGASSEGGGGQSCVPGTFVACYEGPTGTEEVGTCRAGSAECLDGIELGPCAGQILPALERCETQLGDLDEDCNGSVNDHCADWAAVYGKAGDQSVESLTLAANGDLLLAGKNGGQNGSGSGVINLGGDDISASGRRDYLARLSPDGRHLWSQGTGGSNGVGVRGLVEGPSGDLFAAGSHKQGVSIGTTSVTSTDTSWTLFLARLPAGGGDAVWIESYGNGADQQTFDLAAAPDGLVLAGHIAGSADFGPPVGILAVPGGDGQNAVVAKVDEDGLAKWARQLGGSGGDRALRVATDSLGDVYVAGWFATDVDFGGCMDDDGAHTSLGDDDAFVARLDGATGACVWSESFGGPADQAARGLVVDEPRGLVYLGLSFEESVTDGSFEPIASAGDADFLLAVLDRESGSTTAAHPFGGPGKQEVHDLALGPDGAIAVAFSLVGQVDFGGGLIDVPVPIGGQDTDDAVVVLLEPDGAHRWSRWFRGGGGDDAFQVIFGNGGALWVSGEFVGEIDFGTGLLGGGNTAADGYLLRLQP
jgi:hypothetical protein